MDNAVCHGGKASLRCAKGGAGTLYWLSYTVALNQTRPRPLAVSGRMGGVAAAEVISHFGARPETDLQALFLPPATQDRGQTLPAGAFPAAIRPLAP